MTLSVRDATLDDVATIAALEAENLGPDSWPHHFVAEGVAGRLPTVHYLVAELDGAVVGYAVASVVVDLSELQRIAVSPAARRRQVGTALLDGVLALAAGGGADRLLLEVREDNTGALAFYAARGFVEVDRRPRYYRDGTTAVVLCRGLGRGCGGGDLG